jgi:hypothetical protein
VKVAFGNEQSAIGKGSYNISTSKIFIVSIDRRVRKDPQEKDAKDLSGKTIRSFKKCCGEFTFQNSRFNCRYLCAENRAE